MTKYSALATFDDGHFRLFIEAELDNHYAKIGSKAFCEVCVRERTVVKIEKIKSDA